MNEFPRVDFFPVATQQPSARELARLCAMGAPAWTPMVRTTPLDLALCLAADRLNGTASNAAEEALKANKSYAACTRTMPNLASSSVTSDMRCRFALQPFVIDLGLDPPVQVLREFVEL